MTEYNVYGILYADYLDRKSSVFVAEKSEWDAISLLEETLKEIDKDNNNEGKRGNIHAKAKNLGIKHNEKGILFGYDTWSLTEL